MPATAAWGLMLTTVAAVFGLGIGMTVRHSSAAISITLVWTFVIENLVRGFAPPTVYRFLPFNPPNGLLNIETTSDPEALAVALTRVQDALLFSSNDNNTGIKPTFFPGDDEFGNYANETIKAK